MNYIEILLNKAKKETENKTEYLKEDIATQEEFLAQTKRSLKNNEEQLKQINEALEVQKYGRVNAFTKW